MLMLFQLPKPYDLLSSLKQRACNCMASSAESKKVSHTGLKLHGGEYKMTEFLFNFWNNYPFKGLESFIFNYRTTKATQKV